MAIPNLYPVGKSPTNKGYSKKPQNKNRAWIKVIKENMGRKVKISCDGGSKEMGEITGVSYDARGGVVVLETESHSGPCSICIDHIVSLQILDDETCSSKLPDPWTSSPKVEKAKKEDDIPDIWKRKDLGGQKERRG